MPRLGKELQVQVENTGSVIKAYAVLSCPGTPYSVKHVELPSRVHPSLHCPFLRLLNLAPPLHEKSSIRADAEFGDVTLGGNADLLNELYEISDCSEPNRISSIVFFRHGKDGRMERI